MIQAHTTAALSVPRRQQLIDRLSAANRRACLWIAGQFLALLGVSCLINWKMVLSEPLISTVAIGIMVGPWTLSLLRLWAEPKIEIGDLREATRFGVFDKHRLRFLHRDTLQRLGLPDQHLPVYITADKSLNARALTLGLGVLIKSLNGIYLHRQVLHKLEAKEIQDIIGHELGHHYRYYLISDRFEVLTILLGGSLGLLLAQFTGLSSYLSVLAAAACATGFWRLTTVPRARHGTAIEYLCDDFGAHVHGVDVSITGLLKLGVDAEMQLAIEQQALLSRKENGQLNARQVMEAVQTAIPYGPISPTELTLAVERSIRQRQQHAAQVSLSAFLQYAWASDTEDANDEHFEEQAKKIRQLNSLPRLPWESCLSDPQHIRFEPHEIPRLIEMIESHPNWLLFRLPTEAGAVVDIHPPLRDRILYLWYNRQEIEQDF